MLRIGDIVEYVGNEKGLAQNALFLGSIGYVEGPLLFEPFVLVVWWFLPSEAVKPSRRRYYHHPHNLLVRGHFDRGEK